MKIIQTSKKISELTLPWQKFRIGINSKTIWTIPNHFEICVRANADESEAIGLKVIPTQSEASIRMNANQIFNPNQAELGLI